MISHWRRRSVLAAVVAAMAIGLSACSETEDLDTFNLKMFHTSMGSFKSQEIAKWAGLLGISETDAQTLLWDWGAVEVVNDPDGPLKSYWFDMTTDFCTSSPDHGAHFDFKAPCARHDFGWRNLRRLDLHWNCGGQPEPCSNGASGAYNTHQNKLTVNVNFYWDMEDDCAPRSALYRGLCREMRDLYYWVVNQAA